MEVVEIRVRKLLKKKLFFPLKVVPKCDQRRLLSPIANCMVTIISVMVISVLVHALLILLWPKRKIDFEVTTFCAKYVAELKDDVYNFNGVPYAVAPKMMKLSVKDILGRKLSLESLRWHHAIELDSIESCFASHSNKCQFNNSVWKCRDNKLKKRCVDFNRDLTSANRSNTNEFAMDSDEDCLYLNIRIPKSRPSNSPIVVFIGGTNYATEISSKLGTKFPFYPSGEFVNEIGAIVITVQYRLGPFGTFLDKDLKMTNFAMSDIQKAMKWIKSNAEKFGGDSNKITLLAHGTGATLGLSLVLNSSNYFQSAWFSSGAVHISKETEFFENMYRQLITSVDQRCISVSFYQRFCKAMHWKLLSVTQEEIVKALYSIYRVETAYSSLVDYEIIKKGAETQKPFISIDYHTITDSPFSLIYKNTLPKIPMVFTSMLCELDGFPGTREWVQKSYDQIQNEMLALLQQLFLKTEVTAVKTVWTAILEHVKKEKMTMPEMVIQLFSLIRVTCPYLWVGNKIRQTHNFPVYNIIHLEKPSQSMKALLFPNQVKGNPFYGLDILMLFKRQNIYIKQLSENAKNYQSNLIRIFRKFLFNKYVREINNKQVKFVGLDHDGIKELNPSIFSPFCEKIDYESFIYFLNKIN